MRFENPGRETGFENRESTPTTSKDTEKGVHLEKLKSHIAPQYSVTWGMKCSEIQD